ncbi:SGNH/GDSL hydrolase family protein [Polaribacter aestuariivivens]|uniref:SGNH/GDSL hydrolase family protein n=1 Tax=Polaribacter aestuariivivens TaxID=2304626 RepID=A0A5S3NC80_9FLAO|nr:SGNH/GDSL hydrolase family protein [Polaribacter aestuariivivens]TMM30596.1 SGNH/GDSL hydrolase family protein [Polaribacter aestuariivivens]
MIFYLKKINIFFALSFLLSVNFACAQQKINTSLKQDISETYLDSIKVKLKKKWPNNEFVNLVFHGHSVPTGYTTKGVVDRLQAYPFRTLKKVNDYYPYSVVNTITTSIGGEQSEQGAKRFKTEVLNYKPDVLFIDYALNDRGIGLERAKIAWEQMIQEALAYGTKVVLLTPTPDLREDITSEDTPLAKHSAQIRALAKKYNVGLIDSYLLFKELAMTEPLIGYMSQNNHINQKGHQFVADAIFEYFKNQPNNKNK